MKKQQVQQVSSSVNPADFRDVLYSPALLLDARLGASITDDPGFHSACEWGFNSCVGDMEDDGLSSVIQYGIRLFVRREVLDAGVPLVDRVGVALGWLSALALAQYHEAQEGLRELMELLGCEQQSAPWSGRDSRSVDSAGWPLDV